MPLRPHVPVALACALLLSACAPWDWISGAESGGPRWLALLIGGIELLIIALGIVVAIWPQRSDPQRTQMPQMTDPSPSSAQSADGFTRR